MLTCPACGRESAPDAAFCAGCGTPLGAAAASREVRKTVTALFCDLVGSTALGETHDPEVLRPLLHAYFEQMRAAVERHGGRVEKYIGDAVSAVFGLPQAHEDDALRAVRAGVEMQERLARLSEGSPVLLACRVGVTTGEVLVPADGEPLIGDAMNTASRLQSGAEPGSVVIGEPTWHLVRNAVTAEPLRALEARGKAEPVAVWRVVAVASGSPARARRLNAPMVGRGREAALLAGAFERAGSDRMCELFTVLGVAGAGKSRLVEEFVATLDPEVEVLRGRCLPYGEGITYWPAAELIRGAAKIAEDDSVERVRDKLGGLVSGLTESGAIAAGLAGIVGISTATHDQLVWSLRRTLEHIADQRPLVVVVDDIHWAESALLDMFESVVDLVRHSPILFLCEARPDFLDSRSSWGAGKFNATTITLEPLGEAHVLALIDALAPGRPLPPAVRTRIAASADGNPLFLEEFVAKLIDDGAIDAKGWATGSDEVLIEVPPSIHALLEARLDQLPAFQRTVAERAAVVGRMFDLQSLAALFDESDRSRLPEALGALERTDLVGPDRLASIPGRGYRFRHLLIRDAAYEAVPKTSRAELHERLAGWLQASIGDRQAEIDEILAYHLERAYRYRLELGRGGAHTREVANRAADRLVAAGRRAYERSDITATVGLLGRAVDLFDPDESARTEVLPDLAQALDANGRLDEARACYEEAARRAAAAGDELASARARVLQCLSPSMDVDADERRLAADECQAVFERHRDDRGLALCWRLRGEASWREGKGVGDEAALALALAYARRSGAHREEVLIADGLSASLALGPTPVEDGIRRCLEVQATATDDRGIEMAMAHALAHLYARRGEFDVARPLAARCRAIASESGQRAEAAHLAEVAWDVEYLAGEFEAAERAVAEGCAAFEALGKPHPMLEAFRALAQVAQRHVPDLERLRSMASTRQLATRALLEVAIGSAEQLAGNLDAATERVHRAVEYFETTDLVTMHTHALMTYGDVRRAAGDVTAAEAGYRKALDLSRRKGSIVEAGMVETRLASLRPPRKSGRGPV